MIQTKALVCSELSEDMSNVEIEVLTLEEPKDHEVLIRVKAASVNFPDLLMTKGMYQHKPELPFVLGMEGSGIVEGVGKSVIKIKPGDEVTFGAMGKGAFSEYVVVGENSVEAKPSNLNFAEAASFQTAYLTAYVSLVRCGNLLKGENLLVHGSTGGVGMAAVQLGKFLGANVIATGTSQEKLDHTLEWGADHTILTHVNGEVEFRNEVKEITNGKGADVIYDPVGGDVFDHSIRCINWGGRILIVGFASGRIPTLPINMPLIKGFSVVGVRAGEFGRRNPEKGLENNIEIRKICEAGYLKPHVCKEFPLNEAKESIHFLSQRKLVGKVVILMD
jgi:NADPH2:quinone reductase